MKRPPPIDLVTDFDWDAIEAPEVCPDDDMMALEVFTSTLAWLITFCMSRQRASNKKTMQGRNNLRAGYRRFIALCYIYRPDQLDGRTVRALSKELKCSRQEVNKYITDLSLEFKHQGRKQHTPASRAIFRAAQLRRAAQSNTRRKLNKP